MINRSLAPLRIHPDTPCPGRRDGAPEDRRRSGEAAAGNTALRCGVEDETLRRQSSLTPGRFQPRVVVVHNGWRQSFGLLRYATRRRRPMRTTTRPIPNTTAALGSGTAETGGCPLMPKVSAVAS